MSGQLPLYRVSDELVSFYLEVEALHSYIRRFCHEFDDYDSEDQQLASAEALKLIHWGVKLSKDAHKAAHDEALWLFRKAHAQVFPGKILKEHFPSYHDLAMWEPEYFLTSLQLSNKSEDQPPRETVVKDDWPNAININGIKEVMSHHADDFEEISSVQGFLKMEAAAAANICPAATMDEQPTQGNVTSDDLTPREQNTIEALWKKQMQASDLAVAAGYQNNSNFRSMLSNLVKRDYLSNTRSDGYSCTDKCKNVCQDASQ